MLEDRPGVGVERRPGTVPAHHHLALVIDARRIAVHRPVERVGPNDLRRRNVPERPLDDGPRSGPGLSAVVAGDDLEVAVGLFLHEHQQLAVDDEGASLLVGQRGQIGPGRAAVGAANDPQATVQHRCVCGPTAAPRRSGCRRRDEPDSGRGRNRAWDRGRGPQSHSPGRAGLTFGLGIGGSQVTGVGLRPAAFSWPIVQGRRLRTCDIPPRRETVAGHIGRQSSFTHHAMLMHMATLHVRNIPDDLHERLRRHARENNCTMSTVVLSAVERELVRWEWRKHLAQRPTTDLGVDCGDAAC